MKYENTVYGKFIERLNRFSALVEINGLVETVHVKNTGRCRELLLKGVRIVLQRAQNPVRKTRYDLISVYKDGLGWVNIDSQAPNHVVREWLKSGQSPFGTVDVLKPEFTYGSSRVDFYLERGQQRVLMEVKGCTLEMDGIGYFPDAPTQRGIKHLQELTKAAGEGFECCIAFVIAMPGVTEVRPNVQTHPEFGEAMKKAIAAGVQVLHLPCLVGPDMLSIVK
ncbi:MAG: DNA/RNA nuclease SfsA [Ruminococcaceae bacterium]|nr:DNA/RNA nuclease SfsA [Oscillospiraceae bacterium]